MLRRWFLKSPQVPVYKLEPNLSANASTHLTSNGEWNVGVVKNFAWTSPHLIMALYIGHFRGGLEGGVEENPGVPPPLPPPPPPPDINPPRWIYEINITQPTFTCTYLKFQAEWLVLVSYFFYYPFYQCYDAYFLRMVTLGNQIHHKTDLLLYYQNIQ